MSTISASTTTTTAYKVTADTTGALVFQTGATPTTAMTLGSDQSVTFAGTPTYTGGTANGVAYLNGSKVLTTGSALTFDGTSFGLNQTSGAYGINLLSGGYGTLAKFGVVNAGTDNNSFIGSVSNNNFLIKTYNSTVATFDTAGNLGLGVTPSAWWSSVKAIEVAAAGSALVSSGTGNIRLFSNLYLNSTPNYTYTSTAAAAQLFIDAGRFIFYNAPSGTAGTTATLTQAMTLDASGTLTVSPAVSLTTGQVITSYAASPSFTGELFRSACGTSAGTGFLHYAGYSTGTAVFKVFGNGNVQNTNNSYGAISDIKLKENITEATPKLAGLMQVRIVNYNLKTDPAHKQIGVIAQELEQVFPSLIEETPDADKDGNDLGTTTKAVKYSVFVPMLIKAIQEQQTIIQQLQADVATLKGAA